MAGVIDENGQQWEHCSLCGVYVKFQDLKFGTIPPEVSQRWPDYGTHPNHDLCQKCFNRLGQRIAFLSVLKGK